MAVAGSKSLLMSVGQKLIPVRHPVMKLSRRLAFRTQYSYLRTSSQQLDMGDTSGRNTGTKALRLPPNLVETFMQNVNWFNHHYERLFGIAEIRTMQSKVLEAESEFVDLTQRRKACQDRIEQFKEEVKSIRDELDITPRQSDIYLKLITQEHKILREQLSLDVQLSQLKEREQQSFDIMSKLLRQSHEVERLRQERAKYWQIISIALSLAGSLVALIAQRARSQKSVMNQLALYDARLQELDKTIRLMKREADSQHATSAQQFGMVRVSLDAIANELRGFQFRGKVPESGRSPHTSWVSWVPGLSRIISWTGYTVKH